MMDLFWDLGRLVWLTLLLVAAVSVPAAVGARRRRPAMMTVLPHLVVIAVLAVIAVTILSPAHLLNPFTLLLAFACWPFGRWLVRHRRSVATDARGALKKAVLQVAKTLEQAGNRNEVAGRLRRVGSVVQSHFRAAADDLATPHGALLTSALMLAVVPRCMEALANTRLPNAAAYTELLAAQQLLAGEAGWALPRAAAALSTAISVVSSIAPVHLIRMLMPVAGIAALLSLMAMVRAATGSVGIVIVAVTTAALLSPTVPASLSTEGGGMFVLLSLLFWFETLCGRRNHRWIAVAASLMVALLAPAWLVVVGTGAALMLLASSATLLGAGTAWATVSWLTGTPAPLGWALSCAGIAHLALLHFEFRRPPVRAAIAVAAVTLALAAIAPRSAQAKYVEYDAAARATLEIAEQFPKYRWMIAAPIEQWALSYGRGWHINLHEFVAEHSARLGDPAYRLPYKVDDLFVFVETRPFPTFAAEPVDVPFNALVDPVYRNYRSPAGRASLQFAAYKLSERLRASDPGASIYFDDGRLRVYRFTLR
jgi:hypothetical protein